MGYEGTTWAIKAPYRYYMGYEGTTWAIKAPYRNFWVARYVNNPNKRLELFAPPLNIGK